MSQPSLIRQSLQWYAEGRAGHFMPSVVPLLTMVALAALIFSKIVCCSDPAENVKLTMMVTGRMGVLRCGLLCRRIDGDQYVYTPLHFRQ